MSDNKMLHIELREAIECAEGGFKTFIKGPGHALGNIVIIERENGSMEYYPWGNILVVRATEIYQTEEAEIVEKRIDEMVHQFLVA